MYILFRFKLRGRRRSTIVCLYFYAMVETQIDRTHWSVQATNHSSIFFLFLIIPKLQYNYDNDFRWKSKLNRGEGLLASERAFIAPVLVLQVPPFRLSIFVGSFSEK